MPYLVNIRPRRQITLPAAVLDQLDLDVGDSLSLKIERQTLIAKAVQSQTVDTFQAIQGAIRKSKVSEKSFQKSGQKIRKDFFAEKYG